MKEFDEYESAVLIDHEGGVAVFPGHRQGKRPLQIDVKDARLGVGSVHRAGVASASDLRGGAMDARTRDS